MSSDANATYSAAESGAAYTPISPVFDFTSDISTTIEREHDLQVRVNTHPLNPSLCIPSVHFSITRKDVFTIFRKLNIGYIDYIQFARNKRDVASGFAPVYIHFLYWFDHDQAHTIRDKVNDGESFKVKYDQAHPKRFWKVVRSDLPKLLPNISREPTLSWRTPINDDGTEEAPPLDVDSTGTIPEVEKRTVSLVIPRIRKGYTHEHVRFVLLNANIIESIERIDLTFPKESAPLYTKPFMTAYAHVVFENTPYANYVLNYLNEDKDRQIMIDHDVAPAKWNWYVKKSHLPKPDKSNTNTKTNAKTTSLETTLNQEPTIEF